jgi:hypothetical protein
MSEENEGECPGRKYPAGKCPTLDTSHWVGHIAVAGRRFEVEYRPMFYIERLVRNGISILKHVGHFAYRFQSTGYLGGPVPRPP